MSPANDFSLVNKHRTYWNARFVVAFFGFEKSFLHKKIVIHKIPFLIGRRPDD
jgi:hypothetical protein